MDKLKQQTIISSILMMVLGLFMLIIPEQYGGTLILVIVGCVLFSGGCRLCQTQIKPLTPNGMPLIAAIILILGISLLLFAIKRIFRKK